MRRALALVLLFAALLGALPAAAQQGGEATHYTVPGANATFLSDLKTFLFDEDVARFADQFLSYVVSGCLHGTAAGLTATPSACTAYPAGYYVTETASITYTDAATCWVVVNRDTSGNLGNFSRVASSHYLTDCVDAAQPAKPANSIYLMKVTTAAGAISAVVDLRLLNSVPLTGSPVAIKLTNKTGAALVPGDVVAVDAANDEAVKLSDSLSSQDEFVVSLEGMADGTVGWFLKSGYVTAVKVDAAVTRGRYLWKSATARAAADSGTAVGSATKRPAGSFAVALKATAGAGLTSAYLLGQTEHGATQTAAQVSLTNRTGGALVVGDVVGVSTANDSSVVLADTLQTEKPLVVATASIADTTAGLFAYSGTATVKVTGTVTRGNYLVKSATTKVALDSGVSLANTAVPPFGAFAVAMTADSGGTVTALLLGSQPAPITFPTGQGRLSLSGSTLKLCPYNGNQIVVNSVIISIPDACATVLVGGTLTEGGVPGASTTYMAYAYNSSGVAALQLSATTHATQAGTGVEIRSGDATRTLVGMVRTTAGTAFADSATQRFVVSYFNRRRIGAVNNFTADRTTASTTYVEVNTEIRAEFLTWADEAVVLGVSGGTTNSAVNNNYTAVGLDGTNQEDAVTFGSANTIAPLALSLVRNGVAEGYHYATVLGGVSAGTGTWYGGTYTADTTRRSIISLTVGIRG